MAECVCKNESRITTAERELGKLNDAVFYGNGKPPILAQLAVLKWAVTSVLWLAGMTLTAVVGQVVYLWFK